jgi:hypothetical protein
VEILGLDQYNSADQKIPDGRIDDRPEIYRPDWGLLVFPNREPFNSTHTFIDAVGNETQPLSELVPDIYQQPIPHSALLDASRYFIRFVTYSPPWQPH